MRIANDLLLDYFRSRPCEVCGRAPPSEPHHVYRTGIGGGSRLDVALNLMSLCRLCHERYHHGGGATTDFCWSMIDNREGLEPGQAKAAVHALLRRKKP